MCVCVCVYVTLQGVLRRKIYSNISIRGGFAISSGERDRRSVRREGRGDGAAEFATCAALEEDTGYL